MKIMIDSIEYELNVNPIDYSWVNLNRLVANEYAIKNNKCSNDMQHILMYGIMGHDLDVMNLLISKVEY